MRNLVLLLAGVALTVVALVACTARDDSAADTSGDDTVGAGGNVSDTMPDSGDTTPADANRAPPASQKRRDAGTRPDTSLPAADSIRATRPKLPEVVPDSQPGRWRGLKLPESRPVRPPIESIRQVERAPDSVMKGDSTRPRPPQPDR